MGKDLQSEHERYLTESSSKALIVTDYPKWVKAFYMYVNDDERTVRAMDVLVPRIGEIIGGSQREDRLEVLKRRIRDAPARGRVLVVIWISARPTCSVPHAGFGLGCERAMQFITGMQNIRDVIPFPRVPGYAEF